MAALNYHHLRYFHAIAQAGALTKAAAQLNISPSALSVQLQQLEHQLGHALFEREGRRLVLTEAGQIALERAAKIFEAGDELMNALKGAGGDRQSLVRVGALSTLSRNFQIAFLRPLLGRPDVRITLRSGSMRELMHALDARQLDLVLTNSLPGRDEQSAWSPHVIADQTLSLIGVKRRGRALRRIEDILASEPLIVPTIETHMRAELDAYLARKGITPTIAAEVDDMAMLRLMTREGAGYAIAPPIVMRDELETGALVDYGSLSGLREVFYAVAPNRRFPSPIVSALLPEKPRRAAASGGAAPASRRRRRASA